MYALIYLFRGFTLIWYLISPKYRRETNARFKATRPHKVVFEVGMGIIGVVMILAFTAMLVAHFLS
jgi:hypothetical protein